MISLAFEFGHLFDLLRERNAGSSFDNLLDVMLWSRVLGDMSEDLSE